MNKLGFEIPKAMFTDFTIDGRSLKKIIMAGDLTPELSSQTSIRCLMLQSDPETRSGRIPIYTCHICSDPDCGFISINIIEKENSIVWDDFRHENYINPDEGISIEPVKFYRNLYKPLEFDKQQYFSVLEERLNNLEV